MTKKNNDVNKTAEQENSTPEATEEQAKAEQPEQEKEELVSKSELEAKEKELKECKDRHLRLAAEYDNYRKRTARERENLYTDARLATIGEFLSVYDNLERALSNPTSDEAFKKGIELTFAQLCETLQKMNVEEIFPQNEKFDPNYHNAVMHVDDDSVGEGIVVEVFQKGFKIGDRVLRHAMVKVAN